MNTWQKIGIGFCLVFSLAYSQTIFAQTPELSGPNGVKELKEKVYFDVLPTRPRVGDTVEISTEMYGTPIKDALFTWYVDGKEYEKGIGRSKISFFLAKKTTVRLVILTGEGSATEEVWNFNPQNTVIVWESNTYTPPFYKGKSLYTPESSIILHALNLDAKNPLTNNYYNYNWKVDGKVIGEESGVGRNTYIYQGDLLLQEPYFEVNMTGISAFRNGSRDTGSDSQIDSTAAIRVQTFDTNVFMYESTPLLGILFTQQISDTFKFIKSEATLVAYPLYFGIPSSLSGVYKWSVNNELIKENTNSISFKKTRDNEESILSLSIEQPRSLLQSRDISYIIDTTR